MKHMAQNFKMIGMTGFLLLQLINGTALAADRPYFGYLTDQTFPFKKSSQATISSVFFGAESQGREIYTENRSRKNTYTLEGRARLTSFFWAGQRKKPLMVLMPGVGGTSKEGSLNSLAKIFHSWGYHVLTFDNPFSAGYNLTLSPDGLPGDFEEDSKILYSHMVSVLERVKKIYKPQFSEVSFVTYSLGSQYAQELLEIDDDQKLLNFRQVIMMNPPLDIGYTLDKFDEINRHGERPATPRMTFYHLLRGGLIELGIHLQEQKSEKRLQYYASHFPLSERQGEVVLGGSFKDSLVDILYVAGLVNSDVNKSFSTRLTRNSREPRYQEIRRNSFNDYYEKFILPKLAKRYSIQNAREMIFQLSLKANLIALSEDPRVRMVLTQDDPISRPEDISLFVSTLGNRALLFKYGGHSGLYWHSGFAKDLKAFLGAR